MKTVIAGVMGIVLAATLLAACSAGVATRDPATPETQATPLSGVAYVRIEKLGYQPEAITITVGTTVIWTNEDGVEHNVESHRGSGPQNVSLVLEAHTEQTPQSQGKELASRLLGEGESYRHTFEVPGRYTYHCRRHPWVEGTVLVK